MKSLLFLLISGTCIVAQSAEKAWLDLVPEKFQQDP